MQEKRIEAPKQAWAPASTFVRLPLDNFSLAHLPALTFPTVLSPTTIMVFCPSCAAFFGSALTLARHVQQIQQQKCKDVHYAQVELELTHQYPGIFDFKQPQELCPSRFPSPEPFVGNFFSAANKYNEDDFPGLQELPPAMHDDDN